jgi:hypothetical protein
MSFGRRFEPGIILYIPTWPGQLASLIGGPLDADKGRNPGMTIDEQPWTIANCGRS